jgi:uncharacterized protein with HEPN domain
MTRKDPAVYLQHIRDCCRQIMAADEFRRQGSLPESLALDAVCRNIEVIGEAANRLGGEFHNRHPDIPWRAMISARNLIIHNYDGVDAEIVWGIVAADIPRLLMAMEKILSQMPS